MDNNKYMETLITKDIKISVEAFYSEEYSKPSLREFVFTYQVTIQNLGAFTVQLLNRHWFIFDTAGFLREVQGDGVVGEQPILQPGESYNYQSWSNLSTEIGKMYGYYTMRETARKQQFKALIPEFDLIAPFKLN